MIIINRCPDWVAEPRFRRKSFIGLLKSFWQFLIFKINYRKGTSFRQAPVFRHLAAGGGGGTQIWFRRGCAAEAAKPIPIFKGHFGGKGYLLLRVFSQENYVFVYFSDEMGENYKSGGYV